MAIKAKCSYCGTVLDAIQILVHALFLITSVHFNIVMCLPSLVLKALKTTVTISRTRNK